MEFQTIRKQAKYITFRADGTYILRDEYFYTEHLAIIDDEVLTKLKEKVTLCNTPIKDGDTILFKESSFPKLFLNSIDNCPITRVIKESKATRIVTDSKNVISPKDVEGIEKVKAFQSCTDVIYLYDEDNVNKNCVCGFDKFLEMNKMTIVENLYKVKNTLTESKLTVIDNYDKLATTEELVRYINGVLHTPDEEEKRNLLAMLGSSDPELVELGVNMVRLFDISDCLYDVYAALAGKERWDAAKTAARINRSNVRWKYLMGLGGMNLSKLRNFNRTWGSNVILEPLGVVYNLPFLSLEQKRRCWIHCYCLDNYSRMENEDSFQNAPENVKNRYVCTRLKDFGMPERYADIS